MKLFVLPFFAVIFFLCFSCSKPTEIELKPPDSPPILEMSKELTGLWDVNGKILELRLYENGFAEFDFVDYSKKVGGKLNKTDDLKTAKRMQLNDSQMQELLKLLTNDKFLNLKDTYKPNLSCIDNFIENVIVFRYQGKEKKIVITGHCDDLKQPNKKYFPTFPTILSDLYIQIDEVKKNPKVNK